MGFDLLQFHERAVRTESHESVDEMRSVLVDALESEGANPVVDDAGNTLATRTADGFQPGDQAVGVELGSDGGSDDDASGDGSGDGGTHLVLNTHIDTVPPHVPFAERDDGAVVEGRGACDAKGPLAALVDAFLTAGVTDEGARLTIAITPDEETVQTGAAHLAGTLDADGFVVGEPTGLDVCNAARGQYEGTITITGKAAHAATPGSGANAIRAMAPILQAMETYDQEVGPDEHDSLGHPTLTPTVVEGGAVSNQVPEECVLTFDRRPVPPETPEAFITGLEEHLSQWIPTGMALDVEFSPRETPFLRAFDTDPEDPLVEALARTSGGEVRPFGAATEASYFAEHAPTVVFGPGDLADDEGAVAHSEREYVRRDEIRAAARSVRDAVDALL